MTTPDEGQRLLTTVKRASEVLVAARESYSRAADLVRNKVIAVQALIGKVGRSQGQRIEAEAELELAEKAAQLTRIEVDEAIRNWDAAREVWRAHQEDAQAELEKERAERQERATASANRAAWAAAAAAVVTFLLSLWQAYRGH